MSNVHKGNDFIKGNNDYDKDGVERLLELGVIEDANEYDPLDEYQMNYDEEEEEYIKSLGLGHVNFNDDYYEY